MRRLATGLATAVLFTLFVSAPTAAQSIGAGVSVGTNGLGLQLTAGFTEKLNARVGGHFFSAEMEGDTDLDDTNMFYTADGNLSFVSGIVDFHPTGGSFRISAGAFYNTLTGGGSVTPNEDIDVEGRAYTPSEVGTLAVDVDFDSKIAPYAGLGFGNAISGGRFGFTLDLGVLYVGSPNVDLTASGMLTPTASAEQEQQIERNLESVKWYPVINLGFTTRLF